MKYCMIEVAFGNKEEANKAIDELLDKRLVASCQILESNSIWNWKQKRENSNDEKKSPGLAVGFFYWCRWA